MTNVFLNFQRNQYNQPRIEKQGQYQPIKQKQTNSPLLSARKYKVQRGRVCPLRAALEIINYDFYSKIEYHKVDEKFLWKRLSPLLVYLSPHDITQVYKAFIFAYDAHSGDVRKSGEKFVCHPVEVARILAELRFDVQTVMAGLLHDTVEDTNVNLTDIGKNFGAQVQRIVDGETRLSQVIDDQSTSKEQKDASDLARLFLAMTEDVRIILVKLADRLHNMRTMQSMPEHKQKKKSRETIQVYAPIARLIGLYCIKEELEELCFTYLEPDKYKTIKKHLTHIENQQEGTLGRCVKDVEQLLQTDLYLSSRECKVSVHNNVRTCYSIYKKDPALSNLKTLTDIGQVRVVLEVAQKQWNILEPEDQLCYRVLGLVHSMWRPIPGEIQDYIATPKQNGYQALHTKIHYFQKQEAPAEDQYFKKSSNGNAFSMCVSESSSALLNGVHQNGKHKSIQQKQKDNLNTVVPVQMQIQTQEMYVLSEYGIASLNWTDFKSREDYHASIFQRSQEQHMQQATEAAQQQSEQPQTPTIQYEQIGLILGQTHLTQQSRRQQFQQPDQLPQTGQFRYQQRIMLKPQDILRKQQWLKCIQEWQVELLNNLELTPRDFVSMVVDDLFNKGTYVFTRGGDILRLPKGATVVDFAYQVHTEVGNSMLYALVNGQVVKPCYELQSADAIEVICDEYKNGVSIKALNQHKIWLERDYAHMKSTKYKLLKFLKSNLPSVEFGME